MTNVKGERPTDGPQLLIDPAIQGRTDVILVTRLSGPVFALNPDLIERADCTPDTVVTLVDGTKYVITETLAELVELIHSYRASIVARAQRLDDVPSAELGVAAVSAGPTGPAEHGTAPVVRLHRRDS